MKNLRVRNNERPVFPKRAVVTAGMPYGNKELHFGHVGGMFVHADVYARFLRDRIGKDNVIFVSGTDCYGSPIVESYRKLKESGYTGTIEEYVTSNYESQKKTLENFEINLNLYGTSAFGESGRMHDKVSQEIFDTLYNNGYLVQMSTPQYYDDEFDVFLNGRQVIGRCPIDGCTSEKAYADECSLGHQYMPSELIDPISALSGKKPSLKEVTNWYFRLEDSNDRMRAYIDGLRKETNTRKYQLNTIDEFLKDPVIHVSRKYITDLTELEGMLPEHTTIDEEKKPSVTFVFKDLKGRDEAKATFDKLGIFFRAGKTLVPFRLSGNVDWGVKVPSRDGLDDLTFWVWPESLWAPVSFTRAYLKEKGASDDEWMNWWDSKDCTVYQFIGEDNIYFYGIAEMAMLMGLKYPFNTELDVEDVNFPHLIANRHILFMDTKASSSSEIKPPMASELLNHYSAEQLRMHFISLGLSTKSTGFKPQVYMPEEEKVGVDTVLKEGNLLTNVFNRLVRSCFYTIQKYNDCKIPSGEVSQKVLEMSEKAVIEYEKHMYNHDFHRISYVLDEFIRDMNKYWSNNIRIADKEENQELRLQTLVDSFYLVKIATVLLHPVVPSGCDRVRQYLNLSDELWNWDHIFDNIDKYVDDLSTHEVKFLEPKVDFFEKPAHQYETDEKDKE